MAFGRRNHIRNHRASRGAVRRNRYYHRRHYRYDEVTSTNNRTTLTHKISMSLLVDYSSFSYFLLEYIMPLSHEQIANTQVNANHCFCASV